MLQKFMFLFLLVSCVLLSMGCAGKKIPPPSGDPRVEMDYCAKLAKAKKTDQTITCLEAFKSRHPGSDLAGEADLMIADNYYKQKNYLLAADTYQAFLKGYPYHPKADFAYYRSGLSYFKSTPKLVARDQTNLESAVQNFGMVVRFFPNSPYKELSDALYQKARLKQARKEYKIARFYKRYGEYRAAIPRFEGIIKNDSGLGFDEKSYYALVVAYAKLHQIDEARTMATQFQKAWPQSELANKAYRLVY